MVKKTSQTTGKTTSLPPVSTPTCTAIRKDGSPCQGKPLGSGLCFVHDPVNLTRLPEWARKGGKGKSNIARATKRMAPGTKFILSLLEVALVDVYTGAMGKDRADALSTLAGAWCRVYDQAEVDNELDELLRRDGRGC